MSTLWHSLFTGCALAPAAALFGKMAGHCRLPQITGYLLFGVLVGPYVFRLITDETIQELRIIDEICLSAIATAAGAELHLAELQKAKMQVTYLTLAVSVFSWGFCYLALFAMLPFLNVTDASTPAPVIIGITSLGATLMVARSPASAMAVLHETGGKGPFCNLVMAVVVVKDVLVVVGFALNLEAIRVLAVEPDSTAVPLLSQILEPFMSITMSITIGIAGSVLLGMVLRLPVHAPGSRNVSSSTATLARAPLLLATATSLFHLAASLQAEPLLACVTSGLICANRRYDRGQRDRDELQAILSLLMPGVNVAFFGLTGASLRLWALADALWVAGVVCVVRLAALYCGSWLGCWMSTVPPEQRQVFWMSMVTQAGVALGLARMVGARFPGWGTHFQTVAVSIIIINLIAGPPLFKLAIQQTGEAHRIPRAAAAPDMDSRHATSAPTLETAASLTASIA